MIRGFLKDSPSPFVVAILYPNFLANDMFTGLSYENSNDYSYGSTDQNIWNSNNDNVISGRNENSLANTNNPNIGNRFNINTPNNHFNDQNESGLFPPIVPKSMT